MLEADLVVERENAVEAQRASLLQMAVSSIPNMGVKPESTKTMAKTFRQVITALLGDR